MIKNLTDEKTNSEFETLLEYISKDAFNSKRDFSSDDQTIAVVTSFGNIYKFHNNISSTNDEDRFIQLLINNNDIIISTILCVWHNGGIDLPSYHFRKSLYNLNPNNKNAKIILDNGNYHAKRLFDTLYREDI